jgi:hypothetical protein
LPGKLQPGELLKPDFVMEGIKYRSLTAVGMTEETSIFDCQRLNAMFMRVQSVQQNPVMPGMETEADKEKV